MLELLEMIPSHGVGNKGPEKGEESQKMAGDLPQCYCDGINLDCLNLAPPARSWSVTAGLHTSYLPQNGAYLNLVAS